MKNVKWRPLGTRIEIWDMNNGKAGSRPKAQQTVMKTLFKIEKMENRYAEQ